MNKREASKIAKNLFGPTAQAVRRSSPDRRLRNVIAIVEPGGLYGREKLYIVSSASSFDEAIRLAAGSDYGQKLISTWKTTQEQFEEFRKNPAEFTKKMSEALELYKRAVEEQLHGRHQEGFESEVRGPSSEGPKDGSEQKRE